MKGSRTVISKMLKCLAALILTASLMAGTFPGMESVCMGTVEAAKALENPRIVEDSSMNAGQKVTWDCVWFGSYPQAEVVASKEEYTAIKREVLQEGDIIEDPSLYSKLQNSTQWDENEDVIIDGKKYHRITASDATQKRSNLRWFYYWSDVSEYHYFRYEPIKWRILQVDTERMLLLADTVLDYQFYNTSSTGVWADSSIRTWLNSTFLSRAFTKSEKAEIQYTTLNNAPNIQYGTNCGQDTEDRVFLLSGAEVTTESALPYGFVASYGILDDARKCKKSSTYTKAMGIMFDANLGDDSQNCGWLLRSLGDNQYHVMSTEKNGYVDCGGAALNSGYGIRPALNLTVLSEKWSEAGTVCSDGTKNEVTAPENMGSDEPSGDESDYIGKAGITYHYSASDGTRHEGNFIYSDYMFYVNEETIHYNNDLAKASLAALMAGYSDVRLNSKWTEEIPVTASNNYGRACNIAELYRELKFSQVKYFDYSTPLHYPNDKVAFSIARKYINKAETIDDTSQGEDTVLAVVLRGGGYGAEWASNFNVVDGDYNADHYGFGQAADKVKAELDNYIQELKADENTGIKGELKIWICGYSRAAATANRVAHDINAYGAGGEEVEQKNLYAYTFATPNVATHSSNDDASRQRDKNIFNIVSPQDVVPRVPLYAWEYERYGNTLYLPTDSSTELWARYTDMSGKRVTGDNKEISPGQEGRVELLYKLAKTIVKTRESYKNSIQMPLIALLSSANLEAPEEDSDERYEEMIPSAWEMVGISLEHVFKKNIASIAVNLGRAHEPELYYARLDTMSVAQLEQFSKITTVPLRKLQITPVNPYLLPENHGSFVKLSENVKNRGSCVDMIDSAIVVYLYGEDGEVTFDTKLLEDIENISDTIKVNISISEMDENWQKERTISYGNIDFSVGDSYQLSFSGDTLDNLSFISDNGAEYAPEYDSDNISAKQTHKITVVGGEAEVESAYPGRLVEIYATEGSDTQYFDGWEISEENSDRLLNSEESVATLCMPDSDVTVTASYQEYAYEICWDVNAFWNDKTFDASSFDVYKGYDWEEPMSEDEYELSFAKWTENESDAKFSATLKSPAAGEYYVRATMKENGFSVTDTFTIQDAGNLENYFLNMENYWDDESPSDVCLTRIIGDESEEMPGTAYKVTYASYEDFENNNEEMKGLSATAKVPADPGEYVAIATPAAGNYSGYQMTVFYVHNSKDISEYEFRNDIYISGAQTGLSLWREKSGEYEKLSSSAYDVVYMDAYDEEMKGFPTEAGEYSAEFTGKGEYKGQRIETFSVYEKPDDDDIQNWGNIQSELEMTLNPGTEKYIKFQAESDGYYIAKAVNDDGMASSAYVEAIFDELMGNINMTDSGYVKLEKGSSYYIAVYAFGEDFTEFRAVLNLIKCNHDGDVLLIGKRKSSCTKEGYTGNTICDMCQGVVKYGEKIAQGAHSFGTWKIVKNATALSEGKEQTSCSICGAVKSRAIKKLSPKIKLNANSLRLKTKQSTSKFRVSGLAQGDYVKKWSSMNKKIVTVAGKSNGTCKIKAKKAGKTYIKITLASGLTKKVKVTVQKKAVTTSAIKGLPKTVTISKGKSYSLQPIIEPITSTSKITYKSAKGSVAKVSSKGVIKGKKKGTTKITVSSGKKKVKITVRVK